MSEPIPIDVSLDTLGGYHPDAALRKWSPGSCWESEGRYLYKTVREMKPRIVVEVGRYDGCSTSHLALGCLHNDFGRVYSIDCNASMGAKIPPELLPWIEKINADALTLDWRKRIPGDIDLLLEDGEHAPGFTHKILSLYPARRVIVHDVRHPSLPQVYEDAVAALGEADEIFQTDSDCGYGIWKRKGT